MECKIGLFDAHIGGPHQLFKIGQALPNDIDIICGDCFDFANVDKDYIERLTLHYTMVKAKYGNRYTEGNHECSHWEHFHYQWEAPSGRICASSHGHLTWDKKKIRKWQNKEDGAGSIKRGFSYLLNRYRDTFGGFKITDDELDRAFEYMNRQGFHMMALGHKHPLELKVFTEGDMELRFYPRGIHPVYYE